MKKLFLFLSVITFGLTLSSCLGSGNSNFTESSIVYIKQYNGIVYGRTLSGNAITSAKIKMMQPGTFKAFTYTWDEEYGFADTGSENARIYNVVILAWMWPNRSHRSPGLLCIGYRPTFRCNPKSLCWYL